jgi:hypothetical protein
MVITSQLLVKRPVLDVRWATTVSPELLLQVPAPPECTNRCLSNPVAQAVLLAPIAFRRRQQLTQDVLLANIQLRVRRLIKRFC